MKRLAIVVLGLVLVWSAYWVIASSATKSGLNAWFDARRSEGWVAETTDISVLGYPYRLDATLSGISLGDPETGLAWEAEFFQLLTLSYRPNHIIAVWPHSQLIATPYDKYDISTTQMRASATFDADTSLPLARAVLEADTMKITARSGGTTEMTALNGALQRLSDQTDTYKIALSAKDLVPASPWRLQIDPGDSLPRALTALDFDMTVAFDAPWDRFAIEKRRPQPTNIQLKLAKMHWGTLEINAAGDLDIDAFGYATGRIDIKARNWREILRLAVASKTVPQSLADTLEVGLSLISQLAGNPKTLDITLDFDNGQMSLGPIPLGMGPIFKIR